MIKRYLSILIFIFISYLPFWIAYGTGKILNLKFSYNPATLSGLMAFAVIMCPFISAVVTTRIINGQGSVFQLFKHSFQWRFSWIWYFTAVLIPIIVTIISIIAAVLFKGVGMPEKWFSPSLGFSFLLVFLIYNGIGEETGWRGFALPLLRKNLGSLGGSLAIGIIWALWHLPLFHMPGSNQYGDSIILYVYLLTCWSIVMTYLVCKARGSIFVAILFHESINFIAFSIRYPGHYVYAVWGIAAVVTLFFLPKPLFNLPVKGKSIS